LAGFTRRRDLDFAAVHGVGGDASRVLKKRAAQSHLSMRTLSAVSRSSRRRGVS
jgi:hypothetical protein